MEDDKYNYDELKEAVFTIIASKKVELIFLLGDFDNEKELKCKIKEAIDFVKFSMKDLKTKDYERTIEDLELFNTILFGDMRNVPLNINGCFKDLAKWRLQHGR